MTPQELEQLQQLIGIVNAQQAPPMRDAPVQYDSRPAPAPQPDLAKPYNDQAGAYQKQASDLERQAANPYPQPHGVKEHVVDALRAGMENFGALGAPGGHYGQEQIRQKRFDDENKQRLDRAKDLRTQAQQQQDLGQRTAFQTGELENQKGNLQVNRGNLAVSQQQETRLGRAADDPVISETSPGTTRTVSDRHTGATLSSTTAPAKAATEKNPGYRDVTLPNGHVERRYFDQSAPETVTYKEDIGQPSDRTPPKADKVVQAQATINGQPVLGTLNTETNVFTPAKQAGDASGAPVLNATGGNAAARAGAGATVDLVTAERLLNTMSDTLARIESGKSQAPGADDMVLLSNHIAMTFGGVKGARTGKDLIEAHLRARSLGDTLEAAAQRVLSGGQLTPGQRKEFVALATQRVGDLRKSREDLQDYFTGGAPGAAPAPPAPGGGREIHYDATGRRIK